MQEPERVLAIILNVEEERYFKTYFDAILTDRRFLFIQKKSRFKSPGALLGFFTWGLPGMIIGAPMQSALESKKKQSNEKSDSFFK